jgi:hypothetical protein
MRRRWWSRQTAFLSTVAPPSFSSAEERTFRSDEVRDAERAVIQG